MVARKPPYDLTTLRKGLNRKYDPAVIRRQVRLRVALFRLGPAALRVLRDKFQRQADLCDALVALHESDLDVDAL